MRPLALICCLFGTLVFASQARAFLGFLGDAMEEVAAPGGQITVDASALPPSSARHYRYQQDGKVVRFFVVRDSQGVVRAALDACEACWRAGKGYRFTDGVMLCVNCGQRFSLARIGLVSGGCNPHPFQYRLENDSIIISAQDLMLEAKYFPENGR